MNQQSIQMIEQCKPYTIVSIEGNIGSGKSTLLNKMKEMYKDNDNIVFLDEPVELWETIKDKEGNTMIQKFYKDQEKYSFSFQMMAYISRLASLKEAILKYKDRVGMIFITERSLYTDKYVFAKMLYDSDKIEDVNYQIYCKWFDVFTQNECQIDKIVYVKVDPTICNVRIKNRDRLGENFIPLEYLAKCHCYHEMMMEILHETDTLVVNGGEPLITWINDINIFIEK